MDAIHQEKIKKKVWPTNEKCYTTSKMCSLHYAFFFFFFEKTWLERTAIMIKTQELHYRFRSLRYFSLWKKEKPYGMPGGLRRKGKIDRGIRKAKLKQNGDLGYTQKFPPTDEELIPLEEILFTLRFRFGIFCQSSKPS